MQSLFAVLRLVVRGIIDTVVIALLCGILIFTIMAGLR